MFRTAFLCVCLSLGILSAQNPPFEGPIEGFIFDTPTKSIRAVTGSVGSAYLGPAVLADYDFGSVAPRQNYAIVFRTGRCFLVTGLGSAQQSAVMLAGSFLVPDGAVWSADGTVAVLYSQSDGWVQILSGFPDAASLTTGPVLSVSPLGALSGAAVDAHGEHAIIGAVGPASGIYEIAGDNQFVLRLSAPQPVALAFADDREVLYAIDGTQDVLFELNLTNLTSQSWPLDGFTSSSTLRPVRGTAARRALRQGDPGPVRIALKPGHDSDMRPVIYVADGGQRRLLVYDATGHGLVASVPLDFSPESVTPLGRNSYLLGARSSEREPLWSFKEGTPPAVRFVPPTPLTSSGGLQ
jgi:hypothetical protein